MKIRILMFSLLGLIFFNSCSSDSNSSDSTLQNLDPNTILPKKIIRENAFDESKSYEFFYNQSKLDYIHYNYFNNGVSNEFDINFTYNGNLISEIKVVDNSGQIYSETDFTYNNNKLVNKQITIYDYMNSNNVSGFYDCTYTYNSTNNIITRTGLNIYGSGLNTFTITNNLVFRNNDDIYYSTSHSPFKNIIGIQEAFIEGGTEYAENGSFLSFNEIFFSTTKNIIDLEGGRFVYIYNDIEFPTTALYYEGSTITPVNYQIIYQ